MRISLSLYIYIYICIIRMYTYIYIYIYVCTHLPRGDAEQQHHEALDEHPADRGGRAKQQQEHPHKQHIAIT